jgi:hypothetical protein
MKNRTRSSKPLFLGLLAVAVLGSGAFLMTKHVPAPTAPIEKELDAKTLLDAKPVQ